eukprot:scaffold723_cov363-Prasinococcus_capsulatus_cf.AAC.20
MRFPASNPYLLDSRNVNRNTSPRSVSRMSSYHHDVVRTRATKSPPQIDEDNDDEARHRPSHQSEPQPGR